MTGLPAGYRQIPERMNIAGELIDRIDERGYADRTAFVWDGGEISFSEFARRVNRLAHGLSEFGIEQGMPVLVRMDDINLHTHWRDRPAVQAWLDRIRQHGSFAKTYYFGSLLTEKYPHLAKLRQARGSPG